MSKDIFVRQSMASASFDQYYDPHIRCDWCGVLTRGRIYDSKPDVVVCGSCFNELKPLSDGEEKDIKTS